MKKVLIIEDDSFIQEMFAEKFAKYDAITLNARTSAKGEKIAKEEMPDMIILDLVLPDGDGLELLKRLKSNAETKHIKVIVITNMDSKEKMEEALSLGVEDYFIKTNESFMSVVKMIKTYLGLKDAK
ncbi:MAG: histidine kinase [uncultured bacterium]|nr:MAG: histidine kinase [uncultured bacterium]OGJ47662.1 MAG: hypothetical protein A2244_02900 [Candidatus Peregrinibacteria bacterium RIFOXYA2_FULL_41_18]OGJ49564.1 MAG: hypothetical protein A2344_01740 [Candidatus Peregrinibacteria bacterium RIFOXYB12_FULL_41_12]